MVLIEDKVSFKYYIEHNHDYIENPKNYACNHNGIKYGADMKAVEMSICNVKNGDIIEVSKKSFRDGKVKFKGILSEFIENCASYDGYFDRMINYKSDRQFKIYTEKEYQKEIEHLQENLNNSNADVFRDTPFIKEGSIFHMSVNVNMCRQMDYCCEIIPENELKNWFFCLRVIPIYEDISGEELKKRSNKVRKISDEALKKKYDEERNRGGHQRKQQGTIVSPYTRSEVVSEMAKRRAKGMCELSCDNGSYHAAPFMVDGIPYLESHHVKWLSQGGADVLENVVALCPNCHKKIHIVNEELDNNKLLDRLNLYMSKLNTKKR